MLLSNGRINRRSGALSALLLAEKLVGLNIGLNRAYVNGTEARYHCYP